MCLASVAVLPADFPSAVLERLGQPFLDLMARYRMAGEGQLLLEHCLRVLVGHDTVAAKFDDDVLLFGMRLILEGVHARKGERFETFETFDAAYAEDLTPQQMQQRKGLSTDFQCLKARGYKPFFRGATLKCRDGPVIRKCARGEANKVVAAAAQAARATAPPPTRQPHPQRTSVAINPSEVLHQSGVAMVKGPRVPLTATEAQAFNDVVGEFGASRGGI